MEEGLFTVKIRRSIDRYVRPNAEQLEGKTFNFLRGWDIGKTEPYPGEVAWVPDDKSYPKDGPHWIASGDLLSVDKLTTKKEA